MVYHAESIIGCDSRRHTQHRRRALPAAHPSRLLGMKSVDDKTMRASCLTCPCLSHTATWRLMSRSAITCAGMPTPLISLQPVALSRAVATLVFGIIACGHPTVGESSPACMRLSRCDQAPPRS